MLDWICLSCGCKLAVPDEHAGSAVPCPACSQLVRLPFTQVPIPPFPLPRSADGTVVTPGDFTVGSPVYRAENDAVLESYRRWRWRGLLIGLVPSLLLACGLSIRRLVNYNAAEESFLSLVLNAIFGLACAAGWGGLLGASLGTILSRWFIRSRLPADDSVEPSLDS